jgi:hypothetical protein
MEKILTFISIFLLTSVSAFASNSAFPRVDADIATYASAVARMNSDFAKTPEDVHNIEWVKLKLHHLYTLDHYMRMQLDVPSTHGYSDAEETYFMEWFAECYMAVEENNVNDIKDLLKVYRWFTISEFGTQTEMLVLPLVQMAEMHREFQMSILAILQDLYKIGETKPQNYAYLYDIIAASWEDPSKRTLQRYGTQGTCTGFGTWKPIEIEDPENIDQRRAEFALESMAEYIKHVTEFCN